VCGGGEADGGALSERANLFGLPGISVPCGYDGRGLPVGLQLMGRAWEEALLLRMAAVVERGVERRRPQGLVGSAGLARIHRRPGCAPGAPGGARAW
jgi:hypothetical protein